MIGRLAGKLLEKDAPYCLIDVNGVGYELAIPLTTSFKTGAVGEAVVLYTHFSVSENSQQLFGFASRHDRDLFRLLIKVNGVGPKMGISILSMEPADLIRCIQQDNILALTKVPGVGKKTAERLIIETRDKIKDFAAAAPVNEGSDDGVIRADFDSKPSGPAMLAEAESALVALGYKPAEASKMVNKLTLGEHDSSESLIRAALKSMMS